MDTKFQTSFIPKTSLEPTVTKPRSSMGLFSFLSSIIFFISLLVALGAFGWHKYLLNQDNQIKADLDRNIKSFEPQTIDQYVRLDNRIESAKDLLSKHVALSYIFDFLSEQTISSVKFNDFKYDVGTDGTASITMNGQAKSYNAVAYQSEIFGKERALKNPLFSNLDLDQYGNVTFNFTAQIDPGFIVYTRKASTSAAPSSDGTLINTGMTNAGNTPSATTGTTTASEDLPTLPDVNSLFK